MQREGQLERGRRNQRIVQGGSGTKVEARLVPDDLGKEGRGHRQRRPELSERVQGGQAQEEVRPRYTF